MNEKVTKHFDAGQFVKGLKSDFFHEDRMTGEEWAVIERGYKDLGVPDLLSTDQMIALAYALTARAVTTSHF